MKDALVLTRWKAQAVILGLLPALPAKPGECRVCGCVDEAACPTSHGPCWWVDADDTLCSACLPPVVEAKTRKRSKSKR